MENGFQSATGEQTPQLVAAIEKRLIADLFYHANGVIAGTLVLFAVNFVFYYETLPESFLWFWTALMLGSCGIRGFSLLRYQKDPEQQPAHRWHKEVVIAYVVMATGWSLLGLYSVVGLPAESSIVAIITVAGITGSAAATTSASPMVFKCVGYIALAPLSVALVFSDNSALPYAGAMSVCYLVVLNRASARIHDTLKQSVTFGLENEHLVESLARQSTVDPLTGLSNRRALNKGFKDAWDQAVRSGQNVGLILCDIDHFKEYNDNHGHLAGDNCLQQVAKALTSATRTTDLITARYGGEEFAVLLPDCDKEALQLISERLRAAVQNLALPHGNSKVSPLVTISVGASYLVPAASIEIDELIRSADSALYKAKEDGRNCVKINHTLATATY